MSFSLRAHKVLQNPLLHRKQMVVTALHPGKKAPTRIELRKQIAKQFKAKSEECVILYGIRTDFGGGRTTGFALVYDTKPNLLKIESRYRKIRFNISQAKTKKTVRKARKERKNKDKKNRGVKNQKEQKALRRQKNQ